MRSAPLSPSQKTVLRAIFKNCHGSPRSISEVTKLKLVVVLRALKALQRKGYLIQRAMPNAGEATSFRLLKTVNGVQIQEYSREQQQAEIEAYMKKHRIRKSPPGNALGITRSDYWDFEL